MAGNRWIQVGCLDHIPRRGARRVLLADGTAVAVFRTADDEIFALVDRCPHKAGPLSEGIVQGNSVACPLHGWVIDLATGEAEAPDVGCTRTIPVRREGERILISVCAAEEITSTWKAVSCTGVVGSS